MTTFTQNFNYTRRVSNSRTKIRLFSTDELLFNLEQTKRSKISDIKFKQPSGDHNHYTDNDTVYVRVFGKWKCLGCNKSWYSAYTWISLKFGLNNKNIIKDIDLSSRSKTKKSIKVFSGEKLKSKDFLIQECQKCHNSSNDSKVSIINYSNLEVNPNADYLDRDVSHNQALCHKCKKGVFCNKRDFSTNSTQHLPVTTIRSVMSLINKHSFFSKQIRSFHCSSHYGVNVYNDIKYFLDNSPVNNETQIQIEKFLLSQAVDMGGSDQKSILGIHRGLYSKKTTRFLEDYKPALLDKINNLIKHKEFFIEDKNETKMYLIEIIETIGSTYVLSVLLGRFIKIISNSSYNYTFEKNLSIEVSIDLSSDLIREYLKTKYKKEITSLLREGDKNDYSFSEWLNNNLGITEKFNDEIRLRIGVTLIEWLEDLDLLTTKLVSQNKIKRNLYIANDRVLENWKDQVIQDEVLKPSETSNQLLEKNYIPSAPFRLPTIVKPKPYIQLPNGTVRLGGYLLNDEEYSEGLILTKYSLDKQSIIHKNNIIYDVINNINSISYKINTELLTFIRTAPEFYKDTLITAYHPLHNKKNLSKKEKIELQKHVSKFELQENILNIAETFKNCNDIYFVSRIDNRGRLYCMTEYLNYQSIELSKALILFSKPSKIHRLYNESALLYLKCYGANCYGNQLNKLSMKDKVKWIEDNINNILNYDNGVLIQKAENKYLFTVFCIEYKKWNHFYYKTDQVYYNSHLPIQVDASCNGFQHLVLLSREANLRKELNLTPMTYEDKPYDFYSYVLELYKEYLNKLDMSELDEKDIKSFERIKAFTLDRKIFKKMIMTIPYNAENRTMVNNIIELLTRVEDENETWFVYNSGIDSVKNKLNSGDLFLLVRSIKELLDKVAPRVAKLKDYLKKIAIIYTGLQLHIPWMLPSGLEVRQSYLESSSIPIKPFTYSKASIRLSTFKKELHLDKQTRAFMPNLIHSLDATSLMLLLHEYFNNEEFKIKNIYTIHDCFTMPMDQVEYVIDTLRKSYVKLYSDSNYLKELDKNLFNNIKLQYGESMTYAEDLKCWKIKLAGKNDYIFKYPNINEVLGKALPIPEKLLYIAM